MLVVVKKGDMKGPFQRTFSLFLFRMMLLASCQVSRARG